MANIPNYTNKISPYYIVEKYNAVNSTSLTYSQLTAAQIATTVSQLEADVTPANIDAGYRYPGANCPV